MRDHRKLKTFHAADDLVIRIYRWTRSFPREERFGLVSQMRRAAVSMPANIVEGSARNSHNEEYVRFLDTAMSSLRELGYYIDLSRRLGYLTEPAAHELHTHCDSTARSLAALLRSLRTST